MGISNTSMEQEEEVLYDLVVVGHITIDITVLDKQQHTVIGGPPAYAMIAPALGLPRVAIVASIGDDFPDNYYELLAAAGMDLTGLRRGRLTTRFINHYSENGQRTQQVAAVADPIHVNDIPAHLWQTNWMLISPILQDVDSNIIPTAKQHGVYVAVDTQGYVRCRNPVNSNQIDPCTWARFAKVAPSIDVLKCDVEEIYQLTGENDIERAARNAHEAGCSLILITDGHRGAFLYQDNQLHSVPAIPPKHTIDHTGCGDVFIVSFLVEYHRTTRSLWSAFFAAASASFNMETLGPTGFPSHHRVSKRVEEFLASPKHRHYAEALLNEQKSMK